MLRGKLKGILTLIAVLGLFLRPVLADEPADTADLSGAVPETLVQVRAVRVSERTDEGFPASKNFPAPLELKIDHRLEDLGPKLRNLPFRTFMLLSADERTVPLKRKEVFGLPGGQSLAIRPLYINETKVGLSLKWLDKSDVALLDTRLHFDPGESMIVGTDNSPSSGVVLVLEVKPVRR